MMIVMGYEHEYGVDYTKVFSLGGRLDIVRMKSVLNVRNSWPIFQLVVKSAFLLGELKK